MKNDILSDQEAELYLKSLEKPTTLSISEDSSEEHTIKQNNKIIKYADTLLIDRLKNQDGSLRITDIVSAKDSAFKNNRVLQGNDDIDLQLIPSVINIQVINNH